MEENDVRLLLFWIVLQDIQAHMVHGVVSRLIPFFISCEPYVLSMVMP